MMVFSEQPKPVEKINYKDINFLSQQLEAFIKVYKKKVLIEPLSFEQPVLFLIILDNVIVSKLKVQQ